jgi:hypothetical protein
MGLEGGEARDRLALELERGAAIGDALFRAGDDLDDRVTQPGERRFVGLIEGAEVVVDLLPGHGWSLESGARVSTEGRRRLFLSHRTIGSHLYRIFPKLG